MAVPAAIELALVTNFFLNQRFSFRSRESGTGQEQDDARSGARTPSRFLGYEKACAIGALLNALVTLVLVRIGIKLLSAAAAGVVADGVWNLAFNIPNIWRVWERRHSGKA